MGEDLELVHKLTHYDDVLYQAAYKRFVEDCQKAEATYGIKLRCKMQPPLTSTTTLTTTLFITAMIDLSQVKTAAQGMEFVGLQLESFSLPMFQTFLCFVID